MSMLAIRNPLLLCAVIASLSARVLAEQRQCFTDPIDFVPGMLEGEWSGLSDEEWRTEEAAGRRVQYGGMKCPFEDEKTACGTETGLWAWTKGNPRARANAEYARNHTVLKPHRCALDKFDATKLASLLAGGRTLHLFGDSTMRQLFISILCSIPPRLLEPNWSASTLSFCHHVTVDCDNTLLLCLH